MKNWILWAVALCVLAGGSAACRGPAAPPEVFLVTAPVLHIEKGESKTFTVQVYANAPLKSVQFFRKTTSEPQEQPFGNPVFKFAKKYRYESQVTLHDITENLTFIIRAEDAQHNISVQECLIEVVGKTDTSSRPTLHVGYNYNKGVGSSYSATTGAVTLLKDSKAAAGSIDFLLFNGKKNGITLTAPSDALAAQVFNNSTYGVPTWSTRNTTTFARIEGDFNDLSLTDAQIALGTHTDTHINHLHSGEIVVFKTATGKIGLAQIGDTGNGAASAATVTVRML
ncbi:hypothetical protein AGMMS4956_03440 [Bacteroidia bacterium]|nr:hypothetical protein AGMMS4956_03440 [Bacteroidia bacterium]